MGRAVGAERVGAVGTTCIGLLTSVYASRGLVVFSSHLILSSHLGSPTASRRPPGVPVQSTPTGMVKERAGE